MADLIFRHLAGADGEGVYKNGKTGFSVSYFKKKEIDSRYPSGGYMVVGQIGKGKREIGDLQEFEPLSPVTRQLSAQLPRMPQGNATPHS